MYCYYICPNQFNPETRRGELCLSMSAVDCQRLGDEDQAVDAAKMVATVYGIPVIVTLTGADERGRAMGSTHMLEVNEKGQWKDVTPPVDMAKVSAVLHDAIERMRAVGTKF